MTTHDLRAFFALACDLPPRDLPADKKENPNPPPAFVKLYAARPDLPAEAQLAPHVHVIDVQRYIVTNLLRLEGEGRRLPGLAAQALHQLIDHIAIT